MPQAVSNNAVVQANVNGAMHVFSFAGIDSAKIWSGISNRSYRYNVSTDIWDTISTLPDSQTKIAAAASYVKNKIYFGSVGAGCYSYKGVIHLSVYPKPSYDYLNIDLSSFGFDEFTFLLYDATGRKIDKHVKSKTNS